MTIALSNPLTAFRTRRKAMDRAMKAVAAIGDHLDQASLAPVASVDIDGYPMGTAGIVAILTRLLPTRVDFLHGSSPNAPRMTQIVFQGTDVGIRIGADFIGIYDACGGSVEVLTPISMRRSLRTVLQSLEGTDADPRRPTRAIQRIARTLIARIGPPFVRIIRSMADVEARTDLDTILRSAIDAATQIAAFIDAERPGVVDGVEAIPAERRFVAHARDPETGVMATVQIDAPKSLESILPGHPLSIASGTYYKSGEIYVVDTDFIRSAELPDDPADAVRLIRMHGPHAGYGAAIDSALARANASFQEHGA